MNLKQAKELVRGRLSDKRYEHTLNVRKMAVKLAKRYGVDEDKAALAALRQTNDFVLSQDKPLDPMSKAAYDEIKAEVDARAAKAG